MNPTPSEQHQDMPDPLEFTPGTRPLSSQAMTETTSTKSKIKLRKYMMPMIINLVLFAIVQFTLSNSCKSVPENLRGECGAGWLNFLIVLPLEILIFSICLIIMLIGISRWAKG